VLVACPGRLEDLINQRHINLSDVRIVVIDEADRMADMGFLPAVRRILEQTHADRQTVLVSATLDKASDALARSHMRSPVRHSVAPEVETSGNTTHLFWDVTTDERTQVCAEVIKRSGRTIVFSRTKHGADRIAQRLERLGVRATAIHGGRSQSQRDRSLQAFHSGSATALVATDVAARGIHVDGVACVVHFDLPPASADYQHRSGRTARAGASGTVVALVTPDVRKVARQLQRDHGLGFGVTPVDLALLGEAVTAAEANAPIALARLGRTQVDGGHFERPEYDDERPAARPQVRPEQRRGGPRGAAPRGHSSRRTRGAAPAPARQPRRAQPSR
jgi:superfamily II DNA/RNA helicase